ncbi:MAG: FecR family protein [Bacteroidales bacterium]|nr:FecR family protein [Bacteroidales bacterium]
MLRKETMSTEDFDRVDQLIAKYLGSNATTDEIRLLETWISESDENRRYFRQFKNIWESAAELPVSTDKALHKVLNHINRGPKRLTFWQIFQRIAAFVFIPLLIAVMWMGFGKGFGKENQSISYHKVVAAFGTYSLLKLPDGSKVWLNSGSTLRYPEKFGNDNRIVELVGEGYFEVHADEEVPFLVNTPYFTVKATGTKFNIRAEKNFRSPSVTLVEGKVSVQKRKSAEAGDLISYLQPNQHMIYDTLNGQFSIQTEYIYKHFAWKDGKLVFRNDNISEVARRISLQYNVDIEIKGTEIKKYRYRATFESEPLGELLRLLKISSPIDYTEVKPKALPDGTFSRRKIIIFSSSN